MTAIGAAAQSRQMRFAVVALVLASAGMYALAQPPIGIWPLGWLALAPFFLVLCRAGPLAGAGLGLLWGVVASAAVTPWLPGMIWDYFGIPSPWTWPAALGAWIVCAGVHYAAFGAWIAWAGARQPLRPLAFGLAWVLAEWLRAHGPLANPVGLLAYSQNGATLVTQIAELAGPWGPSLVVASVSALLARLVLAAPQWHEVRRPGIAVAVLVASTLGFGAWRLAEPFEEGPPIDVALVQAALPAEHRFVEEYVGRNLASHLRLLAAAAGGEPVLVLWPELAFDFHLDAEQRVQGILRANADLRRVELVAGGLGLRFRGKDAETMNSVFLIRDGSIAARYDKTLLVPFAEPTGFAPGKGPHTLHTAAGQLGVAICSEALHPGYVRSLVLAGAQLLANPSHDDWFGSARARRQQLGQLRMRAIETRRWLLRPASSGVTAVIDPHGRIVAEAPLDEPAFLAAQTRKLQVLTPYVRLGDWLPALAAALVALVSWRRIRESRSLGP